MITTILTAGAVLGILALTGLGLSLARGAALADRRMPHPPAPSSPPATPAHGSTYPPDPRPLDAYEIRSRMLADAWRREGRLTPAGYLCLCELMYAGLDVYPYWSGGELHGTAVVWDGTRGPHGTGERLTVEEWNAAAEHGTEGAQDSAGASEGARGGAA